MEMYPSDSGERRGTHLKDLLDVYVKSEEGEGLEGKVGEIDEVKK